MQNKNKLDRVVKLGKQITGEPMNSITSLSEHYTLNLANKIIGDPLHILPSEYVLLSTGKRYTMPRMWICAVFNRVKRF